MYRRVDKGIFARLELAGVLHLGRLKGKLRKLMAELDMPEPSEAELLEVGRSVHPYYRDRQEVEEQIKALIKQIKTLEEIE